MPVTGDTIVKLADGSRTMVYHLQPGMILSNDDKIVTITVQRFTGWLYTVGSHFITTGTTLIGDNKQMAKTIATKRIYTTNTNIYDFLFEKSVLPVYAIDSVCTGLQAQRNTTDLNLSVIGIEPSFWSNIKFAAIPFQTIQLLDETEYEHDSKVYRRFWNAKTKIWQLELVE